MLMKIGEAAAKHGLTQRTLRYWESSGLISSIRGANGYRYYDQTNVSKLRDIQVLRHIGLPLEQILEILQRQEPALLVAALRKLSIQNAAKSKSLRKLSEQLQQFSAQIEAMSERSLEAGSCYLVFESALCAMKHAVDSTALVSHVNPPLNTKEMILPMVDQIMTKAVDQFQVRILQLSPMRVVCYRAISKTPEDDCAKVMNAFIEKHQLHKRDYGFRHFGFNNPDPVEGSDVYGYEMWVTLPVELEAEAPLWEGQLRGGLYASIPTHMSSIFEHWQKLYQWVNTSEAFEADFAPEIGRQWLEENINYEHFYDEKVHFEEKQLDLLLPIRRKAVIF